jgi:hypothetical protein
VINIEEKIPVLEVLKSDGWGRNDRKCVGYINLVQNGDKW